MFEHYKTLDDGDTDAKLGAHVFAPHAEQVNNQPTLASATIGAPASFPTARSPTRGGIRRGLHAWPTRGSGGQREAVHLPAGRDHGAPQA